MEIPPMQPVSYLEPGPSRIRSTASFSGVLLLVVLVLGAVGCSGSRRPESPAARTDKGSKANPASPAPPGAASPGPIATPSQPPAADEHAGVGRHRRAAAEKIVAGTNRARTARGRSPLSTDTTLARIACWHNQDMLVHDYMSHEDADRRLPSDRVAREHRRLIGTAGENVFEGHADGRRAENWGRAAMKGWLDSPGHRANILRRSFTHLGVCVTHTPSVTKATQVFATVWAYFETPLSWTLAAGDSLSVTVRPVKAGGPPTRYAFVPVGEPLDQAFEGEGRGRPFNGTLHVPGTRGRYGTRFLFATPGSRRFTVLSGPRVRVE
ncbi:MAG: CAP domain-containing protein [Salinibacter sp.]